MGFTADGKVGFAGVGQDGTGAEVVRSTDFGETWTVLDGGEGVHMIDGVHSRGRRRHCTVQPWSAAGPILLQRLARTPDENILSSTCVGILFWDLFSCAHSNRIGAYSGKHLTALCKTRDREGLGKRTLN